MNSHVIRQKFFEYFKKFHHEQVASSSLIPAQDPTILFTNAGMNQFKDVLLGKEKRSYNRAVTIQKCVRAGGKHNDLDNVGFTQRHLTFFEMMGNFSFGDYFKKEAIPFAWNFLTQDMALDPARLSVSVYLTDDEAYAIWRDDVKIPENKIFRLGADNFWQMGDVGPCGPCTEIFFDRGPEYGCGKADCNVPCGCDRFLEVWNVVFMQYDRQADGTDKLLQQTGIDTGMGLERLCVVTQNKESVFDIDIFQPCIKKIEELTGHKYHESTGIIKASFNVLLDHVRSTSLLIADGCAPSNDGRGYVIRKIIRRAALFAQKLTDKNIFPELAAVLIDEMKQIYPDLQESKDRVIAVLKIEIERFSENLNRGKSILQGYIEKNGLNKIVSGTQAFTLYDTYGFPLEVVQLVAADYGCTVDIDGFEEQMELQRQKSGKKMKQSEQDLALDSSIKTVFTGYGSTYETSTITALVCNNELVDSVKAGQTFSFTVEKTPFYVACGGQVDDKGTVTFGAYQTELLGLQKLNDAILITCIAPTTITLGDSVAMQVDEQARLFTMKNHTATHLLQAALQLILGKQVKQAGSVVNCEYLRFDFTYHAPLSLAQIQAVENLINQKIWDNIPVAIENTTLKDATSRGVIAFFGDKYNPDAVRAVMIPGFSAELCGGTHVRATGDIGLFKIVEETALAAGQRRIVAYTGGKALELMQQNFTIIKNLEQDLKVKSEAILQGVEKLQTRLKDLTREIKVLKTEQWKSLIPSWIEQTENMNGIAFGYLQLQGFAENIRDILTALQAKKPGLYFIVNDEQGSMTFVCSLAKEYVAQVTMKQLQALLQEQCGLKSGGSPVMIQGGGNVPTSCKQFIKNWLIKA
ncbi:alanine--tRNA ligase [Candidatus Chromulinivorax destructor]|uniref:Alanine--tRNA ligase n=1 Tax=Candidatus Chromulinivorax destructor TaxID=2066483 RepID=A0A345ZBW6_9BACT|nr:alanine--tRNA ligase [Candidatus Chromulinivorax destructor]AXK60783.1 alanine--tRNA ligase [Candidatus Chromulinivorax destructor]